MVKDKKSFLESESEKLEKCRGESKKMFRVLKEVINKWAPRTDAINDENGVTLTEDEDKRRWTEYSSNYTGQKTTSRLITGVEQLDWKYFFAVLLSKFFRSITNNGILFS